MWDRGSCGGQAPNKRKGLASTRQAALTVVWHCNQPPHRHLNGAFHYYSSIVWERRPHVQDRREANVQELLLLSHRVEATSLSFALPRYNVNW